MLLDRDDLARMVAAAATVGERLGGGFETLEPAGGATADALLRRWRDRVAGGRAAPFRRRLRAQGWTVAELRGALGPVRLRPGEPLPAWAAAVGEAVSRFSAAVLSAGPDRACAPAAPLRFEAVLLPFVAVARRRVGASPHARLLTARARAQLERALLRRLAADWGDALAVELAAFAAVRGWAEDEAEGAFVEHLRGGGLARLLLRLPVLARLAGTRVENWVGSTTELLARLAADRRMLRRAFGGGAALGRVCAVRAGLSDRHRGGRTVCALRFQSGCRVVYKPRPLAADAAWQALLRWLNARRAGPGLRVLEVLDRGGYGWMEHAAAAPCRGPRQAERFHRRAGALLCLAHALGGSDLHAQNVLACGAHPVLVDVEMLLGAAGARPRGSGAAAAHAASVLHTGLLPRWVTGPGGAVRRQGGLLRMDPSFRTAPDSGRAVGGAPPGGSPGVAGDARETEDARAVMAGFTRMYRALLRLRPALLAPGGPLAAFAGAEVRVLRRATWVYDVLLRRARHPAYLAGGVEHAVELDSLCRPWLAGAAPAGGWRALAQEHAALAAGDVPIFTVTAGGAVDEASTTAHRISGHRLRTLNLADLRVQRRLIRLAFQRERGDGASPPSHPSASPRIHRAHRTPDRPAPVWARAASGGANAVPSPVDFGEEALAIAEGLLRTAIRRADGEVTWLGPGAGRRAAFSPVGHGFAHGSAGIGLFLAACAAVDGGTRCRDAALRALRPLVRDLRGGAAPRLAAQLGVGGAAGMGGIVYALTRAAGLLGDCTLLAAAHAAAEAIESMRPGSIGKRSTETRSSGAGERRLDAYSGMAGAVLGLLALHRATRSAQALEGAVGCGQSLSRSLASPAGARLGRGLAHGLPGIAHALSQLHQATGDEDIRAAAERAFAAPEPPARRGAGSPTAWCSGAAGVGLARAAALGLMRDGAHASALDGALAVVEAAPLQPLDHPCCGSLGPVELMLVAADRLRRPELAAAAVERGTRVVRRARARRTYAMGIEDRYTPGFLQGAAGVGYQLLRLADPRLPCALLWE